MATNSQQRSRSLALELRKRAGGWLCELREKRGLSQRELAAKVGAESHTFISQLEIGRRRIPQDDYLVFANALGMDGREFVRILMSYYDPITYSIIFHERAEAETFAGDPTDD